MKSPRLCYDFKQVNSTIVSDSSKNGFAGVIKNQDAKGAAVNILQLNQKEAHYLSLPGNKLGGYVQIPDSVLIPDNSPSFFGFSIVCIFRIHSVSSKQCLWAFGDSHAIYLDLEPAKDSEHFFCKPYVTSGGRSQKQTIKAAPLLSLHTFYHSVVILESTSEHSILSFYLNGDLIGSQIQNRLSVPDLPNLSSCYLGFSSFHEEPCHADFILFSLYDECLDQSDISSLIPSYFSSLPLSLYEEKKENFAPDQCIFAPDSLLQKKQEVLPSLHIYLSSPWKTEYFNNSFPFVLDLPSQKGTFVPLSQLTLTKNNFLSENQTRCLSYLKLLDLNRLLFSFRKTFGCDTKAALPPEGWEEPTSLLRGHSVGHLLSALSLAFSSTKEAWVLEKLQTLVKELSNLQKRSKGKPADFRSAASKNSAYQKLFCKQPSTFGKGYLSAYPPDPFVLLEEFTPYPMIWAPYYTLHKLLAGLLDAFYHTDSKEALEMAKKLGNWIYKRLSTISKKTRTVMWSMYIAGEYGGMNESLCRLYLITENKKYLKAAQFFDNSHLFYGLKKGKEVISGIHANQHIPQLIGAMWEYKATKNLIYYKIARHFWNEVTAFHAYSIGGVGHGENFKQPNHLAEHIDTNRNCETCATYNLLKLTEELYTYEPDSTVYMDYYERALLNHIAASQNPVSSETAHHGVTYMLPIGFGVQKTYSNDYHDFTCCHGTGMENHVKYLKTAYFSLYDQNTLFVNLYFPSIFDWKEKGIRITQMGTFPSEHIQFCFEGDASFTLKLRVPAWAFSSFIVKQNGKTLCQEAKPSSYFEVSGRFQTGDKLEVFFPFTISLDATKDTLDGELCASILYGPFVMVGLSKSQSPLTLILSGNIEEGFERLENFNFHYFGLKLIPMYQAHHVSYHTYFKIKFRK